MQVNELIDKLSEFDGTAIVGVEILNDKESLKIIGRDFQIKKDREYALISVVGNGQQNFIDAFLGEAD